MYLAADAHSLLADGFDINGQPLLVSVNTSTGDDTILQKIPSGSLAEGIVLDSDQNLILNTIGNSNPLAVYKKPWNGAPTSTSLYGNGAQNGYYTGISLNRPQKTLWAASLALRPLGEAWGTYRPIATRSEASGVRALVSHRNSSTASRWTLRLSDRGAGGVF